MNRPNGLLSPSVTSVSTPVQGREPQLLLDRYKGLNGLADFRIEGNLSDQSGYFRLGEHVICYGQCASGTPRKKVTEPLHDAAGM